jgi:hypothetical protein
MQCSWHDVYSCVFRLYFIAYTMYLCYVAPNVVINSLAYCRVNPFDNVLESMRSHTGMGKMWEPSVAKLGIKKPETR